MAVALRAYTQGTSQGSGSVSIAWPTGTVSGDLAVLVAQDYNTNGPQATGWTAKGRGVWYKRVTTADLAGPLSVKGRTTFLQTFTGAERIGNWRNSEGITLTQVGAALFVDGWGPSRITTVDPGATDRLGNQIRLTTDNTPNAVWFRTATTTGYKALTDHDDDCSYVAYEILPVAGPNTPIVYAPGFGVDNAAPIVFSWIHQSNSGAAQEAAKIRIRISGTPTWYYVQAAGTITTTDTLLTQSAQSATINAGALTLGQLYDYQIATQDFGVLGPFSATKSLNTWLRPTVDSITPTSPAESLTPSIAWTRTANVGSPEAWQVRIVPSTESTSDNYLWDSLVTSGTATSTIAPATTNWTNGQTLYAWVRVSQTGGMWSDWTKDNATFTVSWTPPAAPTAVTPANVADGPLQVTIDGIPVGFSTYLQMSYDGNNWAAVENDYDNLAPTPLVNNVLNPDAITPGTGFGAYIAGTGETGATTYLTGQVDGPTGGPTSYARRTITASKTSGSTGWRAIGSTERAPKAGVAGTTETPGLWVRYTGTGTIQVTMRAYVYDAGSAIVTQADATPVTLTSGVWQWVSSSVTATGTYASVGWFAFSTSSYVASVGSTFDATGSTTAPIYFSGTTTNTADYSYTWNGTANASATTRATLRITDSFDVPLAAYGAAAFYRARNSNVISGVTLYSNWTTSSAVASTDDGSYFVDDDNAYIPIAIREEQGPTIVQGITVTYGHGASKARQDQTAPQGLKGTLTLYTETILAEYTLREWLTTKGAWTTRWVPEINPGSGTLFRLNTRMALANAASVQHVIQKAHAARTLTFEWVEQ